MSPGEAIKLLAILPPKILALASADNDLFASADFNFLILSSSP